MSWQAASPGTIAQDANGDFHMKIGNQWVAAPKGSIASDAQGTYHFNADAFNAPIGPPPAPPKTDAIGAANLAAGDDEQHPISDVVNMVKAVPGGILPAAQNMGETIRDPYSAILRFAGAIHSALSDPSGTLTSVGSALRNATPEQVGHNVVAPLAIGGATGLAGEASEALAAARAASEAAEPAAVTNLGMRTGANNPVARNVAGSSAQPTVAAHNQAIADQQLTAQVGATPKPGSSLTTALEDAKATPNAVYARVEAALPEGPLSPNAQQMVQNVGANDLVVHSPDTQSLIDAQKQRLLTGNLTGGQVVDTQRALRYNGFKNRNLPDPENQTLGDAQLKLSDALHQHMVDTLPPDADVSVDQLTQARQALAQIHTLQDAAKGSNIDLQALARMHRDNPGLLTGPMADIAEFADLHPEVTSLPSNAQRFNPSGVMKDVASIDLKRPLSYIQPLAGSAARNVLKGPTPPAPTSGLANDLAPIERSEAPDAGGISATTSTPKLGDLFPGQRGGPPTVDLGALRRLMINPRSYTGQSPEVAAALEAELQKLQNQPRTYTGTPPLGESF